MLKVFVIWAVWYAAWATAVAVMEWRDRQDAGGGEGKAHPAQPGRQDAEREASNE